MIRAEVDSNYTSKMKIRRLIYKTS